MITKTYVDIEGKERIYSYERIEFPKNRRPKCPSSLHKRDGCDPTCGAKLHKVFWNHKGQREFGWFCNECGSFFLTKEDINIIFRGKVVDYNGNEVCKNER